MGTKSNLEFALKQMLEEAGREMETFGDIVGSRNRMSERVRVVVKAIEAMIEKRVQQAK